MSTGMQSNAHLLERRLPKSSSLIRSGSKWTAKLRIFSPSLTRMFPKWFYNEAERETYNPKVIVIARSMSIDSGGGAGQWKADRCLEVFASDGDGKLSDELRLFSFWNGRRVYPGQHMATASVFLNTALIQWAFTICEDKEHPIDDIVFTPSPNTHPLHFSVRFAPRVAPSMAEVRKLLEDYTM